MADKVITSTGDCSACCGGGGCQCALLIPSFDTPYADYATAVAALADYVVDCYSYAGAGGFSAPIDTHTITIGSTVDGNLVLNVGGGAEIAGRLCFSLKSGDVITCTGGISSDGSVDPDARPASYTLYLYDCTDGSTLAFDNMQGGDSQSVSGSLSVTVPADGTYVIGVLGSCAVIGGTATTMTYSLSFTDTWTLNPVIAQWDDSGTTRQLEACPKMLLPPLTESTGTWYADCAAADAALTSAKVSNCIGYIESLTNVSSFTATDGGTSLTLAPTMTSATASGGATWGSLNAADGATLTFTGTVGAGTVSLDVVIYDSLGAVVQSSGATTSPWVSSALAYAGRYTVKVTVGTSSTTTTFSCAITSSGTITVNDIQAAYDVVLDCPARLNCGDSCP